MVSVILISLWKALGEIGSSLFKEASLWWLLTPLFLFWIILEVYFGAYKEEKLGWNTALGNGITLVWVAVESLRFLFYNSSKVSVLRFIVLISILVYGGFIVFMAFSHQFSEKVTFLLASPSPIYFLALITILWGHNVLRLTWWVLADLILLYLIFLGLMSLVRIMLPEMRKGIEMQF